MKGDDLPPEDHILRHCRKGDLKTEADGEILGVFPSAFEPDNDGISVTWIEYFAGSWLEKLAAAREALARGLTLRLSHRLALLNVGEVVDAGEAVGALMRVIHDPIETPLDNENLAHSLIVGVTADQHELMNRIANLVISLEAARE